MDQLPARAKIKDKITMRTNKKFKTLLTLSLLSLLSTGCMTLEEQFNPTAATISSEETNAAVQKRFQDSSSKSPSAVDSAIELAKKHAELSEEMSALKQDYSQLTAENEQMKSHIAVLEPDLKQTKTELEQANSLLINMRIELNGWKSNILGFRDEMRNADTAQLQALVKILEAMGGESTMETADEQDYGAASESN